PSQRAKRMAATARKRLADGRRRDAGRLDTSGCNACPAAGTGQGLPDAASLSRSARTNCTVASGRNAPSSARARSWVRMSAGLPRISDGGRGTAEHIGAQVVTRDLAFGGRLDGRAALGGDAA